MIIEIVIGVILFVLGIIILLGKVDKWLTYTGKQINMRRLRLVRGAEYILFGVWFATNRLVADFYFVLFAILIIVTIILQFTWCRKNPDN